MTRQTKHLRKSKRGKLFVAGKRKTVTCGIVHCNKPAYKYIYGQPHCKQHYDYETKRVVGHKINRADLTQSEKISLGTTEIAKRVRADLKKELPNSVFAIRTQHYSGGSSISIYLMDSNVKVIKDFEEVPEAAIDRLESRHYTLENIKKAQSEKHHQLNEYDFGKEYDPYSWSNGVFLTPAGHELFRKVMEIVGYYNYDHSDIQSDYFDRNFYLHLNIGQWDKPYKGR